MKILFIFTGGTIGSTAKGTYIATDSGKPYLLVEKYREQYGLEFDYDIQEPYCQLSEYNTGMTINRLTACVQEAVRMDYDGIIVTHGTDTLVYSAAALSYAFGTACTPVCLVSSNYPLEDSRANGLANLHGAVRLIEQKTERGVFVSYRNHDGVTYLHRGARMLEPIAFSDEMFSVRGQFYGSIKHDMFMKNERYVEQTDGLAPFGMTNLPETCDSIVRISPYVGMSYPKIHDRVACILHESYHSGTINTEHLLYQSFFKEAFERGIPVVLTGVSEGISYESTRLYGAMHLVPAYHLSPVAAYVKLWLLLESGRVNRFSLVNNYAERIYKNVPDEREYDEQSPDSYGNLLEQLRSFGTASWTSMLNQPLGGDIG